MSLFIEVRVNDRVVASAAVRNTSRLEAPEDACAYEGHADTLPWQDAPSGRQEIKIIGHDRRQSVWSLVRKIAEAARGQDRKRCPFDDPGYRLDPATPCPVCGDLGTFEVEPAPSKCVGPR